MNFSPVNPTSVPELVKHVTMAIYNKPFRASRPPPAWVPQAVGKESERFVIAFIMAINALTQQGYVTRGSSAAPGGRIDLTGSGLIRNSKHIRDNPSGSSSFDAMYLQAFAAAEAKVPAPPPSPSAERPVKLRVLQRKEQKEAEERSKLGLLKSGIRRAKRAVAKVVKQITRRRAPKGRV